MKNKKLVLPLIFTVGIFIIVAAVFIIKKNMPCNDYMNLAEYYGESEKGYTVIAEENINKNKALYEDGHIYLDDEFVSGVCGTDSVQWQISSYWFLDYRRRSCGHRYSRKSYGGYR